MTLVEGQAHSAEVLDMRLGRIVEESGSVTTGKVAMEWHETQRWEHVPRGEPIASRVCESELVTFPDVPVRVGETTEVAQTAHVLANDQDVVMTSTGHEVVK